MAAKNELSTRQRLAGLMQGLRSGLRDCQCGASKIWASLRSLRDAVIERHGHGGGVVMWLRMRRRFVSLGDEVIVKKMFGLWMGGMKCR